MARPLRVEYPGAFYHVTSRGNERRPIFTDDTDRSCLLTLLQAATSRYGAVIHAWCLMTNHYHLLLETPRGNLSQIMRHLNGGYTGAYNRRHRRVGHLLQGRYTAIVVEKDSYAAELSRYIHLNPVRAGMVKHAEEYRWSSCRCYCQTQKCPPWLTTDLVLGYFGEQRHRAQRRYAQFLHEGEEKTPESPWGQLVASTLLGGRAFVEEIKEKYLNGPTKNRDVPALKRLRRRELDEIINHTKKVFGDGGEGRKAALHVCHRYSGHSLAEIGRRFGIGQSGVSQASRRFAVHLAADRRMRDRLDSLMQSLGMSNV